MIIASKNAFIHATSRLIALQCRVWAELIKNSYINVQLQLSYDHMSEVDRKNSLKHWGIYPYGLKSTATSLVRNIQGVGR